MNKEELHAYIEKNRTNICQIAAVKDGVTVYEDTWNGYEKDDAAHVMSVTKSVVSLLVGIAVDRGLIGSIDGKVLSCFPDYVPKRGEKTAQEVTLRHLLTMRAPWKCTGEPWKYIVESEDWTKASLDLLGGRKGLTDIYDYRTAPLHIVTGILAEATGMDTVDFANEVLFTPLGIPAHHNLYIRTRKDHAAFMKNSLPAGPAWLADPKGVATPGYGLCLSATDLAKIGQLCLNKGVWEGKRIVTEEWLTEIRKGRPVPGAYYRGMSYGYLWWNFHPGVSEANGAIGSNGNIIYVDPERNLAVGLTSGYRPSVTDRADFIRDYIIPAVAG